MDNVIPLFGPPCPPREPTREELLTATLRELEAIGARLEDVADQLANTKEPRRKHRKGPVAARRSRDPLVQMLVALADLSDEAAKEFASDLEIPF